MVPARLTPRSPTTQEANGTYNDDDDDDEDDYDDDGDGGGDDDDGDGDGDDDYDDDDGLQDCGNSAIFSNPRS